MKQSAAPIAAPIPRLLALQLCAMAALTLWPYAMFQPWYLTLIAAGTLAWRIWLAWQDAPAPPRLLVLGLAFLAVGMVVVTYHNPIGRLPGLAMLCQLLPLKLLETRNTRDMRSTLLINFFLVIGMFLHEQSGLITAAALVAVLAAMSTAARLQRPQGSLRHSSLLGLRLLAQGIPLMLALFVLFPRVEGPLWGLPLDAYGARTGLSDHMSMGSIGSLIQSGEIAFRASFSGPVPGPRERYWRGPVFTQFDGREWTTATLRTYEQPRWEPGKRNWDYTITLEANNLRWLLSLDFPVKTDYARFGHELALMAERPIRQRLRYTVRSSPDTHAGLQEESWLIKQALWLPRGLNPRTVEQGARISEQESDPAKRVTAGIAFMRRAFLQYTLSPPPTGDNAADDFLFTTHQGFCEHFASSFAILMRAAGVPARIVTGYQGGEVNPVDGTLVVRQSDAHAWTEVWLAGQGWRRIDPTAESFPQRIEDGVAASLPDGETLPFVVRNQISWLRDLRYRWEALGNAWNQWVLGYNTQRQADLMRRLGFQQTDWRGLIALMSSAAGIWLIWIVWRHLPRSTRRDTLDKLWLGFCRHLARRGLPREPWESATDYARRIAATAVPDAGTITHERQHVVTRIAELYSTLRFGHATPDADDIARLKALIQEFKT